MCSKNLMVKCGTEQPVKISVSVSFLKWNGFLSYLWINIANINSEI